MIRTNKEFDARCRHYGMTRAEALRDAPLASYLYLCLYTGDGTPHPHPDTPYNGVPGEVEAWTDGAFVRAAMERAAPWLLMAEEGA